MEAPSCLSWSPAPVWDHSFLVSPNALQHGTQRCHPLSLSSLLLLLFCPDTEAFSYRCFMVTRFCYPLPVLSAAVWIFLLCIEGLDPSLAATPRAQPCSRPGPVSCGVSQSWLPSPVPPNFPNAASAVIRWVTLSNISNSLLNYLICRMNITILKIYNICEVLWYSVWHMYNVK